MNPDKIPAPEPVPTSSDKRPAFHSANAVVSSIKESLAKVQTLRTTLRQDDDLTGYDCSAIEVEAALMRAGLFADNVLRDLIDRVAR